MPCLEISMPETSSQIKMSLAENLTEDFVRIGGFDKKIFGINFNEYKKGTASSGGKIWDLEALQNLTLEDVKTAARQLLHPDKLVKVVVGDQSKMDQPLKVSVPFIHSTYRLNS